MHGLVISIADAVQRIKAGGLLNRSPRFGGLPPETAWKYLRYAGEVARQSDAQTGPEPSPPGIQGAEASRALAVVAAVVEVLRIRGRDGVLRAEKQTAPSGERFRALSRG